MVRFKCICFFVFAMFLAGNCFAAEPFYVDHFEKPVNLIGGRTSIYANAPSRAAASETDREFYGPAGKSLVLRYDKRNTGGPNDTGGWCGYYSILKAGPKYFDATHYTKLTFWVKGENGGENFKVGLADKHWEEVGDSVKSEAVASYIKEGKITKEWQKAEIPLDVFFIDLKEAASYSICFEADCFPEGKGSGTVYIDEVAFE